MQVKFEQDTQKSRSNQRRKRRKIVDTQAREDASNGVANSTRRYGNYVKLTCFKIHTIQSHILRLYA
jgi:hypothetical protein